MRRDGGAQLLVPRGVPHQAELVEVRGGNGVNADPPTLEGLGHEHVLQAGGGPVAAQVLGGREEHGLGGLLCADELPHCAVVQEEAHPPRWLVPLVPQLHGELGPGVVDAVVAPEQGVQRRLRAAHQHGLLAVLVDQRGEDVVRALLVGHLEDHIGVVEDREKGRPVDLLHPLHRLGPAHAVARLHHHAVAPSGAGGSLGGLGDHVGADDAADDQQAAQLVCPVVVLEPTDPHRSNGKGGGIQTRGRHSRVLPSLPIQQTRVQQHAAGRHAALVQQWHGDLPERVEGQHRQFHPAPANVEHLSTGVGHNRLHLQLQTRFVPPRVHLELVRLGKLRHRARVELLQRLHLALVHLYPQLGHEGEGHVLQVVR
mmetsp:Transcript_26830/g.60746  ORF Transcript_26830/g.60746 Transcript_26830/m.60746 type:complete len:370 (-) Transcript_26830:407-1516(-)